MVFNALIGSIALKTANCCCFILKIKQKKITRMVFNAV